MVRKGWLVVALLGALLLSGCGEVAPIVIDDGNYPPVVSVDMGYNPDDPSTVWVDASTSTDPDPYGPKPDIVSVTVQLSLEGQFLYLEGWYEGLCFYYLRPTDDLGQALDLWCVAVTVYDNEGWPNTTLYDCYVEPGGEIEPVEVPHYEAP